MWRKYQISRHARINLFLLFIGKRANRQHDSANESATSELKFEVKKFLFVCFSVVVVAATAAAAVVVVVVDDDDVDDDVVDVAVVVVVVVVVLYKIILMEQPNGASRRKHLYICYVFRPTRGFALVSPLSLHFGVPFKVCGVQKRYSRRRGLGLKFQAV